jgi:hypothetical protein
VLQSRPPALSVQKSDGFPVVTFNMFVPEIASELMRALRKGEMRGARGLVIDLRDNGGGHAETMTDIASAFLPQGTNLGEFTDRDGARQFGAADARRHAVRGRCGGGISRRGRRPDEHAHGERGRDTRRRLAGDAACARHRRAHCGCVLAIRRRHTLPDGGLLDISEMDFRTARRHRLEGRGRHARRTRPAHPPRLSDGRDPALERASES